MMFSSLLQTFSEGTLTMNNQLSEEENNSSLVIKKIDSEAIDNNKTTSITLILFSTLKEAIINLINLKTSNSSVKE